MTSPTLRECPFCGGPATVRSSIPGGWGNPRIWYVACENAGCPVQPSQMSTRSSEGEAVAAWNLRCIGGGVDEANAALIVDAVNERDRLRDLVRRMAKIIGEAPIDWFGASFVDTQVLLTEARAAIGGGGNPTGKGVGR